jgi:hypothetical protein
MSSLPSSHCPVVGARSGSFSSAVHSCGFSGFPNRNDQLLRSQALYRARTDELPGDDCQIPIPGILLLDGRHPANGGMPHHGVLWELLLVSLVRHVRGRRSDRQPVQQYLRDERQRAPMPCGRIRSVGDPEVRELYATELCPVHGSVGAAHR